MELELSEREEKRWSLFRDKGGEMDESIGSFQQKAVSISGIIPSSLGDLEHLLKLNLSRNHITGVVPADFGNLRSIMEIDLSNNDISGPIPEELNQLQNMFLLNVSYNNLVGDIPKSNNFSRFSADSFIGNTGLCGSWLNSPCHVSHPTVRVSISRAPILGIAIGGLLILLMVLIAACRLHNSPPFQDGSLDKPGLLEEKSLMD